MRDQIEAAIKAWEVREKAEMHIDAFLRPTVRERLINDIMQALEPKKPSAKKGKVNVDG